MQQKCGPYIKRNKDRKNKREAMKTPLKMVPILSHIVQGKTYVVIFDRKKKRRVMVAVFRVQRLACMG